MKIIDAHTHIFPDKISDKVSKSIGGFYGMPYFAPASVKNLLEEGEAAGISHFLVCSAAVTPEQTLSITDFMAQIIQNHDCFTALASIHPDFLDFERKSTAPYRSALPESSCTQTSKNSTSTMKRCSLYTVRPQSADCRFSCTWGISATTRRHQKSWRLS